MGLAERLPGMKPGSRMRNIVLGAVYAFVLLGVIGAVLPGDDIDDEPAEPETESTPTPTPLADGGTGTPQSTATATATSTATAAPTATPTPTVVGIDPDERTQLPPIQDAPEFYDASSTTISGQGDTVTDVVTQGNGLVVMSYEHDGEQNFIVEVYEGDSADPDAVPINQIGRVSGVTGEPLPAGEYVLDVTADGPWEMTIAQPLAPAEDIHAPPATASGEGPSVVGPIRFDGAVTVTGSHTGEQNFIVRLANEDSTSSFEQTIVYNEIGAVDGAETRVSHSGVAWVIVEADGDWELEFE